MFSLLVQCRKEHNTQMWNMCKCETTWPCKYMLANSLLSPLRLASEREWAQLSRKFKASLSLSEPSWVECSWVWASVLELSNGDFESEWFRLSKPGVENYIVDSHGPECGEYQWMWVQVSSTQKEWVWVTWNYCSNLGAATLNLKYTSWSCHLVI